MARPLDVVDRRARVALNPDLFARAVIASAVAFGDDPAGVLESRGNSRRALAPAASALFEVVKVTMEEACRPLGLRSTTVFHARHRMSPTFRKAEAAAAEAIRWALKAAPVAAPPTAKPAHALYGGGIDARTVRIVTGQGSLTVRNASVEGADRRGVVGRSAPPAVTVQAPAARREDGRPLAEVIAPLPDAPALSSLSTRRGSLTAGKPAPPRPVDPEAMALGRHPADAAGHSWEARKVRELRERNVPWAHVAQQIGKSETYLRSAYDPGFKGVR
jgi:hypothetical protein